MAAKPLPYAEGDLFCFKLPSGAYALGLIARVAPGGKVIAVYVFQGLLSSVPFETAIPPRGRVVLVARVGDLGLMNGSWQVVRRKGPWSAGDWPIPTFGRIEPISGRAWRVTYRDENPNSRPKETEVKASEVEGLPQDSLHGYVSLERVVARDLDASGEGGQHGAPRR